MFFQGIINIILNYFNMREKNIDHTSMGIGLKSTRMLKRFLVIACISLALLFIMWEGYACWLWFKYRDITISHTFGNFKHNISTVETSGKAKEEIRFAVLGDWRGYGTFEELLKNELDFIILLGDMARNPTDGDHKFLQARMSSLMDTDFPVFYVPGNHDIGSSYPLEKWKQTYGASQFFFKLDANLFIFTYLIEDETGLDYLEETLRHNAHLAKRIFVFNHTPADLGFNLGARILPHQERVLKLLDKYSVDYFIAGDYHGYARVQNGATTFMISGGAGAKLAEESGGFHFALLLTIKDEMVQEKLCFLSTSFDPMRKLMRKALSNFIPFVGMHPFIMIFINVSCLVIITLLVRALLCMACAEAETLQLQIQADHELEELSRSSHGD